MSTAAIFNGEIEATVEMVRNHMVFKDVQNMRVARLKRFMARPTFDDELSCTAWIAWEATACWTNYEFLQRRRKEFARRAPRLHRRFDRSRSHRNGLETGTIFQGGSRCRPGSPARRHLAHAGRGSLLGGKRISEPSPLRVNPQARWSPANTCRFGTSSDTRRWWARSEFFFQRETSILIKGFPSSTAKRLLATIS